MQVLFLVINQRCCIGVFFVVIFSTLLRIFYVTVLLCVTAYGTCRAWGINHYSTFDMVAMAEYRNDSANDRLVSRLKEFRYNGKCSFCLAKTTEYDPSDRLYFNIEVMMGLSEKDPSQVSVLAWFTCLNKLCVTCNHGY